MGKHAEIFIQRVLIEIQPEIVRLKIGADRRLRIIPAVKQKTCQIGPHRFFGERIVVFLITRPDGSFGNTCFRSAAASARGSAPAPAPAAARPAARRASALPAAAYLPAPAAAA